MRLIPGNTRVKIELFKGVSLADIAIAGVAMGLALLVFVSNFGGKLYLCLAIAFITILLLVRFDSEPSYVYLLHILRFAGLNHRFEKKNKTEADADEPAEKEENQPEKKQAHGKTGGRPIDEMIAFTAVKDNFIEYGGNYYGAAIEIPPVEFRFFSPMRRKNSIENAVGRVLRSVNPDFSANIVKIEKPIIYDSYIKNEQKKIENIRYTYESGLISEEELQSRVDILLERMAELKKLCFEDKVVQPYYYIVLFDTDKKQLNNAVETALETLRAGELAPKRLDTKELAVFLKYTNEIDFDERKADRLSQEELAAWAMPDKISFKARTTEINNIITHNMRIVNYPMTVEDGWFAGLMSIPSTKVVLKIRPMDRQKSVTAIDHSLQEINDRLQTTGVESKRIELSAHAESLSELLAMLQGDNECLLCVNGYITSYDIGLTRNSPLPEQPPTSLRVNISSMKKTIRRTFNEEKIKLENLEFNQVNAFIASQVSGYDPMLRGGRGIPSNSVAAAYPWVYANVSDPNGVKLGYSGDVPVFVDFFRRDSERVNSNMVIVGKSGSGKSYATKSLLSNLAAEDTKIFILDPENEYSELAKNLHGKMINVGNASQGRLNPFQIITALDDESGSATSSYSTHLQFLEEFFKQSLTDCDKDALEYLNSLIDRMYLNKGITSETNLSQLKPEDYPIFDDLYDTILVEFQMTENEYIKSMLRTLMNYISKYSTGGRNASIWNGPSTVTTDENFTVFNFQSLLANRNTTIANAQMLLVLKYIDNEIIKNRDYNIKYKTKRKIAVVIDEAHVFIDTKYPIALDFMFQLAKRIRKYNGMQIVITQNIKDFVGSEEIARKSTAIINACQYSFIFALSPNDMDDLCLLYEKSGGISEIEQEQIVSAPRGHAFAILSPQHRSSFKIQVADQLVNMFKSADYTSKVFAGEEGAAKWEEFISGSRKKKRNTGGGNTVDTEERIAEEISNAVSFAEITGEEYAKEDAERIFAEVRAEAEREVKAEAKEKYKADIKKDVKDKARDSAEDAYRMPDSVVFEEIVAPEQTEDTEAFFTGDAEKKSAPAKEETVKHTESDGKLDEALSKLALAVESMGKMNYEAIMSEVRRMITENGPKATPAQEKRQEIYAAPVEEKAEPTYSKAEIDSSVDDLIMELLAQDGVPLPDADIPAEKAEPKPAETFGEEEIQTGRDGANGSSVMERILAGDDDVTTISIDELADFNMKGF